MVGEIINKNNDDINKIVYTKVALNTDVLSIVLFGLGFKV